MKNTSEYGKITDRLNSLADKTRKNGEIWRAAYTEEYSTAKKMIKEWMYEAGLRVYEDSVGNVFGRIEGQEKATIITGSHLDTVKNGGKYDGAAGIITAIAAVGVLIKEKNKPQKSIEVAALIEEEGSRFASAYIGSKCITGQLEAEDLDEKDLEGITLYDAMKNSGHSPDDFKKACRKDISAFIELHVEQGPKLEKQNKQIGIVSGIVGIYSYDIEIKGKQNHAGTTPMDMRIDPVTAAADFILKISSFAKECSETATVTFGSFNAKPGMSNVIADSVALSLDLRDGTGGVMKKIDLKVREEIKNLIKNGFSVNFVKRCDEEPVMLSYEIINKLCEVAKTKGIEYMKMDSGAGHDSQIFAETVPTGMIFIPSHRGISHSPKEYTRDEDLIIGAEFLKEVLFKLAY